MQRGTLRERQGKQKRATHAKQFSRKTVDAAADRQSSPSHQSINPLTFTACPADWPGTPTSPVRFCCAALVLDRDLGLGLLLVFSSARWVGCRGRVSSRGLSDVFSAPQSGLDLHHHHSDRSAGSSPLQTRDHPTLKTISPHHSSVDWETRSPTSLDCQ